MMRGIFRQLAAILAVTFAMVAPAHAQSFIAGEFDPSIPTVTEVLGYEPGMRMSTPAETLRFSNAGTARFSLSEIPDP